MGAGLSNVTGPCVGGRMLERPRPRRVRHLFRYIGLFGDMIRRNVKIPHSRMTKNMLGNVGNLFVKCIR